MKEEKNYKIAFFTLLGFVLGGLIVGGIMYFTNDNKKTNDISNKQEKTNHEVKIDKSNKYENEKKSSTNDEALKKNKDIKSNIESNQNSINKELSDKDSIVLEYLEKKYEQISENITKENAKSLFIEIVDFLFYDGKIKGYTLSELTNKGKIEVTNMCTKIEMKIEEKHPGAIDETETKYNEKKENIINKYKDYVDKYCNDNSEKCENFKSSYETMKESFGKTFGKIKDYGSKGVDKVSKWYSNFKNSN